MFHRIERTVAGALPLPVRGGSARHLSSEGAGVSLSRRCPEGRTSNRLSMEPIGGLYNPGYADVAEIEASRKEAPRRSRAPTCNVSEHALGCESLESPCQRA
jgi:hypothetical protein